MRAFTGALTSYDAVHPEFSDLNQTYVDEIHRSGRAVFPYTINDPDEIRQAFSLGVDGVITDVPVPARRSIPIDSNERSVD
jgi:glycerophosphoryl diester phosphodiesterase